MSQVQILRLNSSAEEVAAFVKFLNIVDKGFRITRAAWATGNQTVLQPHFAKVDKKFTGNQTLYSASVASDQGGNERAVCLSKKAGFLSRGFQ
jgi:hypothetical protein